MTWLQPYPDDPARGDHRYGAGSRRSVPDPETVELAFVEPCSISHHANAPSCFSATSSASRRRGSRHARPRARTRSKALRRARLRPNAYSRVRPGPSARAQLTDGARARSPFRRCLDGRRHRRRRRATHRSPRGSRCRRRTIPGPLGDLTILEVRRSAPPQADRTRANRQPAFGCLSHRLANTDRARRRSARAHSRGRPHLCDYALCRRQRLWPSSGCLRPLRR